MPHTLRRPELEEFGIVYRLPNDDKTEPDYATIEDLKERLGIDDAETQYDDRLTLSLVAAEIKIEHHLGRAFPDFGIAIVFDEWKAVALAADDGEASASIATQVEMSLTSFNEIDYSLITDALVDAQQIIVTSGDFIFDIDSVVEVDDILTFTGTVASGTFPLDGELDRYMITTLTVGDEWIDIVPETVKKKTINLAMLEFKKDDSPLGVAGSDAFIGELDMSAMIRAELNDRTLLGLRVSWGTA